MSDERLEEFSRQRLGGRAVPDDVRLLATAQWEGRGHPFEDFGITIMEPDAQHPLRDVSYLNEKDRADPETMANCAAAEQMAEHLKAVARGEGGVFYGYWLHPQQRVDRQPPPVIGVDSEGQYWRLPGRTLAEACLYAVASDDDELFAEVAAELAQLPIRIRGKSGEHLRELPCDPTPDDLHRQLYYAERERRGLPPLG